MFPDAFIPLGQVPATAARLERAAGELRERAGSPYAVPRLPVTLAHLEGALDELAATMRLLAEAAASGATRMTLTKAPSHRRPMRCCGTCVQSRTR